MPTVKIDSTEVEYRVDGAGPSLVLVYGTGGNVETNWDLVLPQLVASHRIIRPNYAGSGATLDDSGPLTVTGLASQVLAAANAADTEHFDLLGFSLGASVAAYLAAKYPDRVRKLILLAGFTSSADTRLKAQFELWRHLIDHDRRAAAQLIILTGFSPAFLSSLRESDIAESIETIVTTNNWLGMRRQVELDLNLDIRDQIAHITSPTLVIGLTHDHMVAPAHSHELHRLIGGANYLELPSGHLAPLEIPDQLAAAVLTFLG